MKYRLVIIGVLVLAPAGLFAVPRIESPADLALVPVPQNVEIRKEVFELLPSTSISADALSGKAAAYLAKVLRGPTGFPLDGKPAPGTRKSSITFITEPHATIAPEGYLLEEEEEEGSTQEEGSTHSLVHFRFVSWLQIPNRSWPAVA